MATYVSKYTGKQIDSVVEKVLGNNSGGGSTEKESSILTVTVTGNDTDGYTADMTFAEIVAARADGKIVQVCKNDAFGDIAIYDLAKTGSYYLSYVNVLYKIMSSGKRYVCISEILFLSNGSVSAYDLEFESCTGEDGVSPTVSVTEIEGGHRITVTDADGEKTFDVMDGTNGVVTVTVSGNDTDGYTADKTFAEIVAAESEGKVVQVYYSGHIHHHVSSPKSSERWYTWVVGNGGIIGVTTIILKTRGTGAMDGIIVRNVEISEDDNDESPTANVTQTDNGAVITMTDKNGTTTATITNGATYTLTEEDEARIVATIMDNFIDVSEVGA